MDPERGTGRTTRAINNLSAGDIYIVANQDMIQMCKLIRDDIKYISVEELKTSHKIMGLSPCHVAYDHYVYESGALKKIPRAVKTQFHILQSRVGK